MTAAEVGGSGVQHAGHPPRRGQLRRGRAAAFGAAVALTAVSLGGGVGLLAGGGTPAGAATPPADGRGAIALSGVERTAVAASGAAAGDAAPSDGLSTPGDRGLTSLAVPADSGEGRRVVFDQSAQRVWLVDDDEDIVRTYLVSGSISDNLDPGTYEVYSRSARAWGIDDSGTMEFMVRFTYGERAAIGFHSIPTLDGELVQTRAQLGTPRSHGCIRQWRPDAKALWEFAPIGTTVTVVA